MITVIGSQTEINLLKAFAGESQARMRYEYFAKVAKKEGLEQIAGLFDETALNEKEHAKRFFKFMDGRMLEITATYPAGKIGTTLENLEAAADGEKEEWSILYPSFAKTAREEGFMDIAVAFEMIALVEKAHEVRYRKLYTNLIADNVFVSTDKIMWKCRNCGFMHGGKTAPKDCPACLHAQAYFEIYCANY